MGGNHPFRHLVAIASSSISSYGRRAASLVVATALLVLQLATPSAAADYSATYTAASVPASMTGGTKTAVSVQLTNTGTAAWNATGAQPVQLSYHWYDASGAVVLWDGVRTPLTADVPPSGTQTVNAQVEPPKLCGSFRLRFALVKEFVAWFDPEPAPGHSVTAVQTLGASFGTIAIPAFANGSTVNVDVPVTNCGTAEWNATGNNPVTLSYHWFDQQGRIVVWDGIRNSIGTNLPAGQTRTISAAVRAPADSGSYVLAFEMVKEFVGWFGNPSRHQASVSPAYGATYTVAATSPVAAFTHESKSVPVTVRNTGAVTWPAGGPTPVRLSYHWYDSSGALVQWDGLRTALTADVPRDGQQSLTLAVLTPRAPGSYLLRIDLVREGVTWFSLAGVPPATLSFNVTAGFAVRYDSVSAPDSGATGAYFETAAVVTNTGTRTWAAGGANPVRLSYHWLDANGNIVEWDGIRSTLPRDVAPGAQVTVPARVRLPASPGKRTLAWDLVHEGVGWFSQMGSPLARNTVDVFHGVTFYGKGWGHGVGMSQWGAQGWAQGATGTALNGDQIVAKYYPGASITSFTGTEFRVLLSNPSTGCNARTVHSTAHTRSEDGMTLMDYWQTRVIHRVPANQTLRVSVDNTGTIRAVLTASNTEVYRGADPVLLLQGGSGFPIQIDEKLRAYRGKMAFHVAGANALRVVNHVLTDDYVRGSLPTEMPTTFGWHVEAFRAQSYAARTYAAFKRAERLATSFDLYDDTKDQCYGGASVEIAMTNSVTASTAGKILTHNGAPIAAYYSSSNGGRSEVNGCVWGITQVNGRYACGGSAPYLAVIEDPADLAASDSRGPQPHTFWWKTFTAAEMRDAVLRHSGVDIGTYQSVDLSNLSASGRVISVIVRGTAGSAELRGDNFLRGTLLMKSTLVRIAPF